jgi:hypothetical protein
MVSVAVIAMQHDKVDPDYRVPYRHRPAFVPPLEEGVRLNESCKFTVSVMDFLS